VRPLAPGRPRPDRLGGRGPARAVRLLIGAMLLAAGWTVLSSTGAQATENHSDRALGGLSRTDGRPSLPVLRVLGGVVATTADTAQHASARTAHHHAVARLASALPPAPGPVGGIVDPVLAVAAPAALAPLPDAAGPASLLTRGARPSVGPAAAAAPGSSAHAAGGRAVGSGRSGPLGELPVPGSGPSPGSARSAANTLLLAGAATALLWTFGLRGGRSVALAGVRMPRSIALRPSTRPA
jgi:hypothetical protein